MPDSSCCLQPASTWTHLFNNVDYIKSWNTLQVNKRGNLSRCLTQPGVSPVTLIKVLTTFDAGNAGK